MRHSAGHRVVAALGCAVALPLAWFALRWAVVDAVWTVPAGASSAACRAPGAGACWAVVADRHRFILFGAYPIGEQWRAGAACLLFAAAYATAIVRARWTPRLLGIWIGTQAAAIGLMAGGIAGLPAVTTDDWGGVPLTFVIATASFTLAVPAAILLAFGRRSALPAVRAVSTAFIELVRGVPLVTFLFMGSILLPLCLPPHWIPGKLFRIVATFTLAVAAYQAEVVGGGIDGVPRGQREAAAALGLPAWRVAMLVVLPQALRATVPATVNTFIAFFKDTTLVAIVGLFDLLGAAHAAIADGPWVGFGVEVYLFAAAVYGVLCMAISRGGARMERAVEWQA